MADPIKTPLNTAPGSIGDLVLDVLLQEEEDMPNKVTQYPVEDGSAASDHVVNEPTILTITGFISNSPIHTHTGDIDGKARVTRKGDDQLTGTDINFTDLALAYLRKIRLEKKTVTVKTKRGTWENMLVQRVNRAKNKDTGDAMIFTITLVEFQPVKLVFVSAPRTRTKSARAQPRAGLGKKSTPDERSGTLLYNLKKGITKTFFSKDG
jgi:hypothetical protein